MMAWLEALLLGLGKEERLARGCSINGRDFLVLGELLGADFILGEGGKLVGQSC